jgi:hypothetical protein
MPVAWKFDLVDGARVSATIDGVEITRSCIVSGLPVAAGTSDPEVILQATEDSGFPGFFALYPTTIPRYQGATLQDVSVQSRDRRNNSVRLALTYRRKGGDGSGSASEWSLEDSAQTSHVQTYGTAGGANNIQTWHKAGEPSTTTVKPATGADAKNVSVHRMRTFRVLRATARLRGSAWAAIKGGIRGAAESINLDPWGGDPRGNWYFVGPTTRTSDYGRSYRIQLDFLEARDGHFPLAAYFNSQGVHPADCATEAQLRSGGLPSSGGTLTRNGVTLASVYYEIDFNTLFAFSPADA